MFCMSSFGTNTCTETSVYHSSISHRWCFVASHCTHRSHADIVHRHHSVLTGGLAAAFLFSSQILVLYLISSIITSEKTPYIRTTIKALQLLETRIRIRMLVSLSSDTARKQLHLDHSAWSKYHDTIQPKLFLYVGLYNRPMQLDIVGLIQTHGLWPQVHNTVYHSRLLYVCICRIPVYYQAYTIHHGKHAASSLQLPCEWSWRWRMSAISSVRPLSSLVRHLLSSFISQTVGLVVSSQLLLCNAG